MKNDYLLLQWSRKVKNAVTLDDLLNFENDHWFHQGRQLAASFPSDVQMTMHPERPRNTILTDYLFNTRMLLVVSERLKDFLQNRKVEKLEYLPVTILDIKRRPIKERYFIVNDTDPLDCLDAKASGATFSKIVPSRISAVKKMVLDPDRIDRDRQLFRFKNLREPILASRGLARAMDDAKFTAIEWMELTDYDGEA